MEKNIHPMKRLIKIAPLALLFLLAMGLILAPGKAANDPLQLRINRWFEVRQVSGRVFYLRDQRSETARVGMRLGTVGEAIRTDQGSSALLAIDTGIGTVHIAEKTTLRIDRLESRKGGGRVTQMAVVGGQVRLRLRPFTNPESSLRVVTPAGVSAVRGTDFGVSVQPGGKTGLATLTGSVISSAQGQRVEVSQGLQNLTIPGEAPTPPTPLKDDPSFDLQRLTALPGGKVSVVGRIDPVNLLLIGDELQVTNRQGEFDVAVSRPRSQKLKAVVTTPLGKQQIYELAIP